MQSFFLLWLLGAAVIIAIGAWRDGEWLDRYKAMSLLALGLSWPLLVTVFVLGGLLWLVGIALHQYRKH